MKRILHAAGVALLAMAAVWGYRQLFPSDETLIRRLFQDLAPVASFDGNEPPLTRLANVKKLGGFFSPDVVINLDAPDWEGRTIQGRSELVQLVQAARTIGQTLRLEFLGLDVSLGSDEASAATVAVVKATWSGRDELEIQVFKIKLLKGEGGWKITRVGPVRMLQR